MSERDEINRLEYELEELKKQVNRDRISHSLLCWFLVIWGGLSLILSNWM